MARETSRSAHEHGHTRRQVFLDQAESSAPRSLLYAKLCRRFADDPRIDAIVGPDPKWDAPLRLLGALHALVLAGRASWEDVDAALEQHADYLARAVAERPVQTNEVQRCWVLLPCFLELARRTGHEQLDLVELGPSAGLNLMWDRYRYSYAAGEWGSAEAELSLGGEERRPVPAELLRVRPRVRHRTGIDSTPVDVTTEEGKLLLKSFVWPDQPHRLEMLDHAVATLREDPPRLVRADIAEELPHVLAERRDGALTVVWETAALGYLPDEGRRRVHEALEAAGKEAPLAWVSGAGSERSQQEWAMKIRLWPG